MNTIGEALREILRTFHSGACYPIATDAELDSAINLIVYEFVSLAEMAGATEAVWRLRSQSDPAMLTSADIARAALTAAFLARKRPQIEAVAGATLIAAAPELLKALTAASHALKSYAYDNASPDLATNIAAVADAAIAKAEGRS